MKRRLSPEALHRAIVTTLDNEVTTLEAPKTDEAGVGGWLRSYCGVHYQEVFMTIPWSYIRQIAYPCTVRDGKVS